jgi:signal transduction histidine kinase/CheY-like chemotaxis protein
MGLREAISNETGRYLAKAPAIYRYGLAVLLVGLSTLVGFWLRPEPYITPYVFFFPAILISLWLAGFGAGFLATILTSVVADYFFIAPYYSFYGSVRDLVRALLFTVSFGFICWLIDRRQYKAETKIERQAEVLAIAEDKQHILEEQFRQAQKMEAVGRLAGGVAHDFNNLLTIIIGQAQLLGWAQLPEDAQQRIASITDAAERAATLTSQLLAFSRRQILKLEPVDLNAIVQRFSDVLARLLGEDVRTEIILEPLLGFVRGDKNQIEQILMNLAVNSRDAMPNGGKLLIETAKVELDDNYAKTHSDVTPGRYVMLAVSDTGVGIDDEHRAHIFEPFFTTKEQGKGTGLGLSMVYGTVKQMQGSIWVYSELGQGTIFKMYFPVISEEEPEIKAKLDKSPQPERLRLTVLVVEDNVSLRALIRDYLEVDGCTVITAGDGSEAVNLAMEFSGRIDVVLTDVILPGKNGKQVAEELVRHRPEIKIAYTSGYTPNAIVHRGVLDEGVHFLQKPFTRAELVSVLRSAIADGIPSQGS